MKNPYISLIHLTWKYAGREHKKYGFVYAMFICANIIFSLNPLLFGWFIGKLQTDTRKVLYYTLLYAASYIGINLVEWSIHGPARIMERTLAFNISRNFLQEKFHQTLHLTAKWHQDHHSAGTINRIRKAYEALRDFFDKGFMYLYTLTKFIFSVAAILYFSPLFGAIAVIMGLFNIWIISKFDRSYIKTLNQVNEKEHEVSANLFDSLSNIRTVLTLRLEMSMERGLIHKVRHILRPFRRNALINEWKWFIADLIISCIYCVVVVGFVYQHWQPGKLFYVGGLVTLLGYVNQFTGVFQNVAGQYTDLVQYNTNVLGASSITEAYNTQHRPDKPSDLPTKWNAMEINRLNFSHRNAYDGSFSPQSLHNLSIKIARGKKIALIGESGSGKSTLLALLRGLYHPLAETEFKVDGRIYSLETLNESVTLFPQEPEIFENTIAYNVTLGLPFSKEEIMDVCEVAHFSEVIQQLPHGLQTDIKEKGVNLSGGEKQRLALARGILASKDSEVILLDEPTSSVDPKTEAMIYQKIFKRFSDRAIISSIHRLHLLDLFDYIYVLDKGKIIEEGTFSQIHPSHKLLKNK
ncbi:MAG: ABC transporter ATP-binding protein [Flavisolibacter sp.]